MRGTTPTHIFKIPYDTSMVSKLRLTYEQVGGVVIEKTEKDCIFDGDLVTITLTQEDTLKLNDKQYVEIQMKLLSTGGDVIKSEPITRTVSKCLNDEVLE